MRLDKCGSGGRRVPGRRRRIKATSKRYREQLKDYIAGAIDLQPAFPKPGAARTAPAAIRVFRDGREVIRTSTTAGKRIYAERKRAMWQRQGGICGLRISPFFSRKITLQAATFEHCAGRGGGKRDDRIVVDGKPQNLVACAACNTLKGSRSLEAVMEGAATQ